MLILGIDDAGRGPIIGPMILAGVLLKKYDEKLLKQEGVIDSKLLAHEKRIKLSGFIKDISLNFKIVKTEPEEIDHSINSGINLNTLEAIKTAEIINSLIQGRKEKIKVIVDCPSTNIMKWTSTLLSFIKNPDNIDLHCEHKADFNHPSVSAASILAKCIREEEVEKLKKKYQDYGNIGSGYPSDPYTKEFLRKHGKKLSESGLFRKTWQTWKALFPDSKKQKTLGEF